MRIDAHGLEVAAILLLHFTLPFKGRAGEGMGYRTAQLLLKSTREACWQVQPTHSFAVLCALCAVSASVVICTSSISRNTSPSTTNAGPPVVSRTRSGRSSRLQTMRCALGSDALSTIA